jgi:CMP-N-acetylneuraminic acid synthetase
MNEEKMKFQKDRNSIIAIIPARGGSKGIFKKNIRLLAGKPLVYYSIHAARESKFIPYTVVSTDDDDILNVSIAEGALGIKRPIEISLDTSRTIDTIFHALDQCAVQNIKPEIVVLLQPTSPLRSSFDIDNAIELFLQSGADSVISVVEVGHPPHWNMVIEESYLRPIFDEKSFRMRRQDLPKTYLPNGAIFITSIESLKLNHSFYCPKTKPYIMPAERSVDIDNELDLFLAEAIMKEGCNHD